MSTPLSPELLQVLRVRIGLDPDDDSKDANLTAAWLTAQTLAEAYCDRLFDYATATDEEFCHDNGQTISLIRYPLEDVVSVTGDDSQAVDGFDYNKKAGIVYLHGAYSHRFKVEYTGGYKVFPPDLQMAILLTFDNCYGAMFQVESELASSSRQIKAVTVPDVGRVEYVNESTGSGDSSGPVGLLPGAAVSVLNLYRRESA